MSEIYQDIPCWDNGTWTTTSFESRDEWRDFLFSIFREPGKYEFNEVTNEIFIGYTEYDIEVEDSLVNEVHLFHKKPEDQKVTEIIKELSEIAEKFDTNEEESDSKSFILTIGQTGLEIEPTDFLEYDKDNIDLYFNDECARLRL